MAGNITMRFSLGGITVQGTPEKVTERFVERVKAEAVEIARKATRVKLGPLATKLEKTIETEYANGVRYAANNLIGLKSPRGVDNPLEITIIGHETGGSFTAAKGQGKLFRATTPADRGVIYWKQLNKRAYRDKHRPQPPAFFLRTGKLRASLLRSARSIVRKTGVVSVSFTDSVGRYRENGRFMAIRNSPRIVNLGELHIRLMPKIPLSLLPGLEAHDVSKFDPEIGFERALHLGNSVTSKLYGAAHARQTHRPLLQPVFTYWTLFEIPRRIATAINNSIFVEAKSK